MITVFGFGVGLGVCMVLWSWRTHRERAVAITMTRFRADPTNLAACDRDERSVAAERLLYAVVATCAPLVIFLITSTAGTPVPLGVCLVMGVVGSVVGFQLPVWQLRDRAKATRTDFRVSLSAYLDLVSVLLSGGAGIETALVAASRVGAGASFEAIARCLEVSRASRRSPWDVLAEHGARIGVDELPELAATIKLGGEQGARMTASLVAKAESMRAKQLADIEARANAATERMGLPMVVLFLGFLVLLGYPAMQMISAGFGG
ncbi:MAG: hypothetical protein EBX99_05540 [Acidimicrobiia bacterium]|nr:hypothetical protein [Acidimicrobiia bacterium]